MGSKKYRGKLCAFGCNRVSSTADHLIARQFFLPGAKYTPIKVPACGHCNNEKSALETYLTAVLPFAGQHRDAAENLVQMTPKRLAQNPRLHKAPAAQRSTVWLQGEGGVYEPTIALPLDYSKVEALFAYIAKGLAFHHWGVHLGSESFVKVAALTGAGTRVFTHRLFGDPTSFRVINNLADGTFEYVGVRARTEPMITAWMFSMYGGMILGGDSASPEEASRVIGVYTGPKRVLEHAAFMRRLMPHR